jgi:two-component system response regulator VicR
LRTVLIVDDEANIRNILDFSLCSEGYRVVAASDGDEALYMAFTEQPDLIILDVMMPRSDGFEICRRLKSDVRTKNVPVIMLTAKKSRDDRHRGQEVKADEFITKPFSPKHVVERVQSLLGVHKE